MGRTGGLLIQMIAVSWAAAAQAELFVPQGVSGDLEYSYRYTRYDNLYNTTSNMLSGRLATNAYLWQPWFATMGFSLALTQERANNSSGGDSSSRFVTGEAGFQLLPKSNYPFSARYMMTDSRIDNSAFDENPLLALSTARQFSRNQLLLNQGINGKRYHITLRYTDDEAKSDLGEQYYEKGYGVDYTFRSAKQNLQINSLVQTQSNNQNSNESDNRIVSLNHNYYPSSRSAVDTLISHVKNNNYYSTALTGLTQQTTSTIDQASSMMMWRSSEMPLRVNGGIRVHQMDYLLDNGVTSNTLQSEGLNTTLGGSYQITEHLMAMVNGQYGVLRSETNDVRSHNENANLSYSSERHVVHGFDYGWNSSLTGSNQQSGESRAQSVSLALGHSATRSWSVMRRSSVRLSLSQQLEEGYAHSSGPAMLGYMATGAGEMRRLNHNLGLGWMQSDQSGSSMAQLTFSDSRGVVGDESRSQMLNAQLSRSQLLDNRSTLNGNLTWQAWHYIQDGLPDYGVGHTTMASASYRYARPFSLQRVAFHSDLRLTNNNPAVGATTRELYWDNRLSHEIGLMRSSIGLTLRDHRGGRSVMLLLAVKRMF